MDVQKFGCDLVHGGMDLISLVVAATDAEKDPRCLMLAFSCFQLLRISYEKAGRLADLQVTILTLLSCCGVGCLLLEFW